MVYISDIDHQSENMFFFSKLTLRISFNVDEGSTCDNNEY